MTKTEKGSVGEKMVIKTTASLSWKVEDGILTILSRYGIMDQGHPGTLRVKCRSIGALKDFHRYFEGKGTMDEETLIYEVTGNDVHELYYPLFRISTKEFEFLDEDFKNEYSKYLGDQIKSLSERRKNG